MTTGASGAATPLLAAHHGPAAPLDGARVVVTGGAGFIGSHLVDQVVSQGAASVSVVDNLVTGKRRNLGDALADPRVTLHQQDLRDGAATARLLAGADIVFHLACLGVRHSLRNPFENHDVNATATLTLLELARHAEVGRFVHISTSEVFGTAQYVPMDETHPTWPETVYGAAKLAGEAYARAAYRTHGFPTVVLRPFNTFGPRSHHEGDSGEALPRTVVRMLGGQRPVVFGDGRQTRDFMYVEDTARAIALAGVVPGVEGQTFNLGTGSEVSILEGIAAIARVLGRDDLSPLHLEPRPGDVRRLHGDPRRFAELTGFAPRVSFEEGITRLVDWFRAQAGVADLLADVSERNWLPDPVLDRETDRVATGTVGGDA